MVMHSSGAGWRWFGRRLMAVEMIKSVYEVAIFVSLGSSMVVLSGSSEWFRWVEEEDGDSNDAVVGQCCLSSLDGGCGGKSAQWWMVVSTANGRWFKGGQLRIGGGGGF